MVRLNIELPEELNEQVQSRAAQAGHSSVAAYVRSLLLADIESGPAGAPVNQIYRNESELEALLRAGIDSGPSAELSSSDWDLKRKQLVEGVRKPIRP